MLANARNARWMLTLALLCLYVPFIATTAGLGTPARSVGDALLLIVGDVTATSARILYDQVPASATTLHARVYESTPRDKDAPKVYALEKTLDIPVPKAEGSNTRPHVVELRELQPGQRYVVQFDLDDEEDSASVMFHTARGEAALPGSDRRADRVLVVSCDRFVDDHDDVLFEKLARDIEVHDDATGSSSVHFGMAHLGDQIYADAGGPSIQVVPLPLAEMEVAEMRQARYDAILMQFRGIYRETFGRKAAQRVLRVGAHWMIPDDHEILNNFNYERVQQAFQDTEASEAERERRMALSLHYRAGLQAYYEFQYQLQRDFPWDVVDFLEDSLGEIIRTYPVYFSVEVSQLKLFFLDVRFERSFFDESRGSDLSKLTSAAQRDILEEKLQKWNKEAQSATVVLASMPLFFQSAVSAAIAYIVEHETYPGMAEQRSGLEDLFQLFQGYNQQHIGAKATSTPLVQLVVGGDVHMMAHSRVCGMEDTSAVCLDQLITSGVTNGSTAIQDAKLIPFYFLITQLTPVFEIVFSWARHVPLLSSFLPRSSPWYIEYDRVFLGRNYGYVASLDD
ncbi:hypothetical protein BBJ28_00009414 [Nothophytophthora sp. Chile5]|nr:hypothetical protein BBJ28_00009414 [Nothophytophthora sp. Chile5]